MSALLEARTARGDLRNRRMRAILKHFAPAERPSDDLDHGLVDVPSLGAQDCRVRPPLCG